ncbi:MAG: hypothetical protein A3I66_04035 [Burkholderiales bacterium RIFCSPLOWO2_02_FULL_57_36]|nr:MAG: hypothetical protein A3I66_04035 [Burkholderiales bacterium RIFCSPLOWO2_02_FULL_57_36]
MNTTTYYAADAAPVPYLKNVGIALRGLLKALFPARTVRPASTIHDRAEILRIADAYRCTAPSLSQELTAIAYRDC